MNGQRIMVFLRLAMFSTIVFIGDTFPPQRMPNPTAVLSDLGEDDEARCRARSSLRDRAAGTGCRAGRRPIDFCAGSEAIFNRHSAS